MAFGKVIKKLREKRGLSSAEMSAILEVDNPERYRNWEKRDANPKHADMTKIEQIFRMPFEEILKLESLPDYLFLSKEVSHTLHHSPAGRLPKPVKPGEIIPFYDVDFGAGDIEFYNGHTNIQAAYMMDIPEFSGCTAFRTYGDSMEKLIRSGDILFGTRVEDWQSHLEYGQIYGIICTDKRRYLKFIRKAKKEDTHFLLRSENVEYDDFTIPKDKIRHIWLIHGWMNKRV